MVTIYHNPRCSKSRQTLALLEDEGIEPEVIQYLDTPPDPATLQGLIAKLGIPVRDLIRTGEAEYKELGLGKPDISDKQLVEVMSSHPKLIQRPIVVNGDRAAIGRPPESVLDIL